MHQTQQKFNIYCACRLILSITATKGVLLAICPRTDVTSGCQVPMITPAVLRVDLVGTKVIPTRTNQAEKVIPKLTWTH